VQYCPLAALEVLVSTWVVGEWEGVVEEVGAEEAEPAANTVVVAEREEVLEQVQAHDAQDMVRRPMWRELTALNVTSQVLAEYPEQDLVG
jgi:hypothetical protein